jgi:hypothetical protein
VSKRAESLSLSLSLPGLPAAFTGVFVLFPSGWRRRAARAITQGNIHYAEKSKVNTLLIFSGWLCNFKLDFSSGVRAAPARIILYKGGFAHKVSLRIYAAHAEICAARALSKTLFACEYAPFIMHPVPKPLWNATWVKWKWKMSSF